MYGGQQYAVRIHLNPRAIAARGLSNAGVIKLFRMPTLLSPQAVYKLLNALTMSKRLASLPMPMTFNRAIMGFSQGAPVRLQDVVVAEDSVVNNQAASWYNDKRTIMLAIQRQPGTNTVAITDAIKKILPTLTQNLPGGAQLTIAYDRSTFITTNFE